MALDWGGGLRPHRRRIRGKRRGQGAARVAQALASRPGVRSGRPRPELPIVRYSKYLQIRLANTYMNWVALQVVPLVQS